MGKGSKFLPRTFWNKPVSGTGLSGSVCNLFPKRNKLKNALFIVRLTSFFSSFPFLNSSFSSPFLPSSICSSFLSLPYRPPHKIPHLSSPLMLMSSFTVYFPIISSLCLPPALLFHPPFLLPCFFRLFFLLISSPLISLGHFFFLHLYPCFYPLLLIYFFFFSLLLSHFLHSFQLLHLNLPLFFFPRFSSSFLPMLSSSHSSPQFLPFFFICFPLLALSLSFLYPFHFSSFLRPHIPSSLFSCSLFFHLFLSSSYPSLSFSLSLSFR